LEKCLPELEKLLEDDDQSVRTEATIAFRKIEGKIGSPPELEVLALEQDPHGNEALNEDDVSAAR
ncbi:MAG: HEAT repeat domain-containing protein, partial [Gemmataceae bacterium]